VIRKKRPIILSTQLNVRVRKCHSQNVVQFISYNITKLLYRHCQRWLHLHDVEYEMDYFVFCHTHAQSGQASSTFSPSHTVLKCAYLFVLVVLRSGLATTV